jgi:hypothetical protein
MTAEPGAGWDRLRKSYEKGSAGKEQLAALQIGINERLALPPDSEAFPATPSGVVAVNVGNDEDFGGGDRSDFGQNLGLVGCSVTVDGAPLVERGKLVR